MTADDMPTVTVTGRAGTYIIEDEQPDGRLVLRPNSTGFLANGSHPVTLAQFEQSAGVSLQPPDGEG